MWPWEHLAFGYLLYSLFRRLTAAEPPGTGEAFAIALATQLPDVIDKPLGWVFHLAPTGRSIGHSLLFGGPVSLLVCWGCLVAGYRRVGMAFAVGYLSHLLGDVLYDVLTEGRLAVGFLVWPIVAVESDEPIDAVPYALDLFGDFLAFLATPAGGLFIVLEVALVTLAVLSWWVDGAPGLAPFNRMVERLSRDT